MALAATSTPQLPSHPLRNGNFRLLWGGRLISNLGDQCYLVALPWLVLSLTSSGVALGTILMTGAIPAALLMLVGGALSDRYSARKILLSTTSIRTVCVTVLGLLLVFHAVALWQLYVLAFVFGVADAFAGPASQTLVPSIVDAEQLPAASSITQSTQQFTSIVGPAPAGLIVKSLGTAWAFFIDAVSFLFVIGALWRLPDPPAAQVRRAGLLHAVGEGLQYVASDAAMRSLLILAAALNVCLSGPITIGLAWVAKHQFNSPLAFSTFVSAVAAGGLGGAIAAGMWKPRRRGSLMLVLAVAIALGTALLGFVSGAIWSVAAVLLAMGAAAGFLNVHIVAWFQQRVERAMLGRVMSLLMLAAVGLQPVSLAVAGVAVGWNYAGMLLAAATLMLLATISAALHGAVRQIR
ncbi:MAG TPA: MFS transporter [Candidatus Eremiobacteraceae bacterium]|nr:MFS transporter [Candidatus Eremiobacteraceae bacterium]